MPAATKDKPSQTTQAPRFIVTMEGTFFARGENGLIQEPYKVRFPMTPKQLEQLTPQAFFKHHVAGIVMPRKHSNYLAHNGSQLATFNVTNATCDIPGLIDDQIVLLTRDGLLSYIEDRVLPVEPFLYDSDMELRQAILDCRKDKEGFIKNQSALSKKKQGVLNMRKLAADTCSREELFSLNDITSESSPNPGRAVKRSKVNLDDI